MPVILNDIRKSLPCVPGGYRKNRVWWGPCQRGLRLRIVKALPVKSPFQSDQPIPPARSSTSIRQDAVNNGLAILSRIGTAGRSASSGPIHLIADDRSAQKRVPARSRFRKPRIQPFLRPTSKGALFAGRVPPVDWGSNSCLPAKTLQLQPTFVRAPMTV
jgi:hypothetical protein